MKGATAGHGGGRMGVTPGSPGSARQREHGPHGEVPSQTRGRLLCHFTAWTPSNTSREPSPSSPLHCNPALATAALPWRPPPLPTTSRTLAMPPMPPLSHPPPVLPPCHYRVLETQSRESTEPETPSHHSLHSGSPTPQQQGHVFCSVTRVLGHPRKDSGCRSEQKGSPGSAPRDGEQGLCRGHLSHLFCSGAGTQRPETSCWSPQDPPLPVPHLRPGGGAGGETGARARAPGVFWGLPPGFTFISSLREMDSPGVPQRVCVPHSPAAVTNCGTSFISFPALETCRVVPGLRVSSVSIGRERRHERECSVSRITPRLC